MAIPILNLEDSNDAKKVDAIIARLRLDPAELSLSRGERAKHAAAVMQICSDVAARGDDALVEISRKPIKIKAPAASEV